MPGKLTILVFFGALQMPRGISVPFRAREHFDEHEGENEIEDKYALDRLPNPDVEASVC